MSTEVLLSTAGAAAIMQVSDETVRRWADAGLIRHIRLPSGQLRFRRSDLEQVIAPVDPSSGSRAAS
jgi:excisionase family DNA binding protein